MRIIGLMSTPMTTRGDYLERLARTSQQYPYNIPQHLWTADESKLVAERQRVQLEQQKAETASRSPVATLLHVAGPPYIYDGGTAGPPGVDCYTLRVAIKTQADLWRKEAIRAYDMGYKQGLEQCADELEGKNP